MQHGLVSHSDLTPMLQAVHPHSPRALVRVPGNDPSTIGWCLDAGATGVIVPLINSADEAEAAVRACMYPPRGDRSTGPARAAIIYGDDYVRMSDGSTQCIPMIETTGALGSLDKILSLAGVNAVYVGPSDLSVNLGLGPGEPRWRGSLRRGPCGRDRGLRQTRCRARHSCQPVTRRQTARTGVPHRHDCRRPGRNAGRNGRGTERHQGWLTPPPPRNPRRSLSRGRRADRQRRRPHRPPLAAAVRGTASRRHRRGGRHPQRRPGKTVSPSGPGAGRRRPAKRGTAGDGRVGHGPARPDTR